MGGKLTMTGVALPMANVPACIPTNQVQAQFLSTGWNPLAFKTATAEGDDIKLTRALAPSGALLVVMIPAAIKVVF